MWLYIVSLWDSLGVILTFIVVLFSNLKSSFFTGLRSQLFFGGIEKKQKAPIQRFLKNPPASPTIFYFSLKYLEGPEGKMYKVNVVRNIQHL